jgi:hypothetical protein
VIRALGRRLSASPRSLNPSGAPLGMLDVERITRVQPPISTVLSRPSSTLFTSSSTKV